jgi:hypothetical protein
MIEEHLKRWDSWRKYIAEGGRALNDGLAVKLGDGL